MFDGKVIIQKLTGSDEERAVSPVIGVILMVAITVILAAVIAAFVLDIGPGGDTITASVDVEGDGTDTVELNVQDGSEAEYFVLVESGSGTVVDSDRIENNDDDIDPTAEEANTGASFTVTSDTENPSPDFLDKDSDDLKEEVFDDEPDYEIWAVSEELEPGDDLDDAASQFQAAEFELD